MNALATSTENTLPKLELAVMFRYFMILPKVSRPLSTPSSSTIRLFFQEDDVGRFLGDVGAAVHRNTDVGIAQGRGVVDAVTEETHGVTVGLQRLEHPGFLQRRQLGEHRAFLDPCLEGGFVHLLDVLPEQRHAGFQADFAADLAGHHGVVTGQHLDGHAHVAQRGNRRAGGFLRWIEEGQETANHQFAFVSGCVLVFFVCAFGISRVATNSTRKPSWLYSLARASSAWRR